MGAIPEQLVALEDAYAAASPWLRFVSTLDFPLSTTDLARIRS
jgi:hypothetical protein